MLGFGALDALAILIYIGIMVAIVFASGRAAENTDEYLSGGQRIPWWAAALSFMATAISAATFLAAPDAAFKSNLSFIISGNLSSIIALIVVSVFFIPAFYKCRARTVYDVLDHRFGSHAAVAGSISFVIGRLLGSGVRLFMASIPLAMILAGRLDNYYFIQSIILLAMVGVALLLIYRGGIRTVIWTDVAQFVVLIGAALVTVLYIYVQLSEHMTWDQAMTLLREGGKDGTSKLTVIDSSFGKDFSIFSTIGISLLFIGAYGCDQDMTQRLMTCKDSRESRKSVWTVIAISIPKDVVFAVVGLSLFLFYQYSEATLSQKSVFASFIYDQMPSGIKGLAICGLCAAAISGLTSEINALASTFTTNCLQVWRPQRDDAYYLKATKLGLPIFAILLAGMAIIIAAGYDPAEHESLLSYALKPMIYAYSGLVGVFFCALFTPRGNALSAIIGLLSGFICVAILNFGDFGVSFPWQMTIGCALAFIICVIPSGTKRLETALETANS